MSRNESNPFVSKKSYDPESQKDQSEDMSSRELKYQVKRDLILMSEKTDIMEYYMELVK